MEYLAVERSKMPMHTPKAWLLLNKMSWGISCIDKSCKSVMIHLGKENVEWLYMDVMFLWGVYNNVTLGGDDYCTDLN